MVVWETNPKNLIDDTNTQSIIILAFQLRFQRPPHRVKINSKNWLRHSNLGPPPPGPPRTTKISNVSKNAKKCPFSRYFKHLKRYFLVDIYKRDHLLEEWTIFGTFVGNFELKRGGPGGGGPKFECIISFGTLPNQLDLVLSL